MAGKHRVFSGLALGSGVLVVRLIAAVAAFLLSQAVPALVKDQANSLTDRVWDIGDPRPRGSPSPTCFG